MNVGVIIAAAGQGSRMRRSYNKQFITLGDRPLIAHTLQAFERMTTVSEIVIVTRPADISQCEHICAKYRCRKVKRIVTGGESRQQSVRRGLRYVDTEWVMVHDGARPFVTEEMVSRLLEQVNAYDAVVPGVPAKDTIKQVDDEGVIVNTPDRAFLWAVQTPQLFRRSELIVAHEQAHRASVSVTDDAMLMERMGIPVKMVEGHYFNLKITTPEDLLFAEVILQQGLFMKR